MNCKPGDLALIVRSSLGNNGKLVRVIEPSPLNGFPLGAKGTVAGHTFVVTNAGVFCWVVEALGSPIRKENGNSFRVCPAGDEYLRPLRDDPGQDETLSWAGLPQEVMA